MNLVLRVVVFVLLVGFGFFSGTIFAFGWLAVAEAFFNTAGVGVTVPLCVGVVCGVGLGILSWRLMGSGAAKDRPRGFEVIHKE